MRLFFYKLATDKVNGFGPGCVKFVLKLLSFIFDGITRSRAFLYRHGILSSTKLNVPVVSIGNLTVGGSGKTPVVEWLANQLRRKGKKVVVLTRGYMPKRKNTEFFHSDEAMMLEENLNGIPVLTGPDRSGNAKDYLKNHSVDVFLLDDGFQHLKLRRDLDVIVVDGVNPWGNASLLPRGILREPKSALKRADVFIISKTDQYPENIPVIKNSLKRINPNALILEARHQPVEFINLLDHKSGLTNKAIDQLVCALCSIGSPESFARTIDQCGLQIKRKFEFMDHYDYQTKDINTVVHYCRKNNVPAVITTQKDAVKLRPHIELFRNIVKVYALKITIIFKEKEDEFIERILGLS